MDNSLSAAILAGGQGRRMEVSNKAGLIVDGEKIISRIIKTIAGLFTEVIIITNSPDDFTEFSECRFAGDLYSGRGPLGGIHSALYNAHSSAVFIFAGDMPFLDKKLIVRQINEFSSGPYDILVPRTGPAIEPLHAVYSRNILDKLDGFIRTGESNAIRDFFSKVSTGYMDTADTVDIRQAFSNINTPADLSEAERIIRRKDINKI